jgi:hypothetical protein
MRRTKPIPFDRGAVFPDSKNRPTEIIHRIGARLLHEAREALPPTILFFIGFNFIVLTTNLLVAQYLVTISKSMLATMAALVVGKAVLVGNEMSLLRRYYRAPLIQSCTRRPFYWSLCFWRACSSVSFTSHANAIRWAIS